MQFLKQSLLGALLALIILAVPACKSAPSQATFATPDDAAVALQKAFQTQDESRLQAIFGREGMESVASGDPVADRHDRELIGLAMAQSWHWAPHGSDGKELIIGDEQWPFPVPLIKAGSAWRFDSDEGREEVLARRIGGNELDAIAICRDYVRAQKEYALESHDGKPAGQFAQRIRSSAGRQDGLFWGPKRGEKNSPLNDLVAAAVAEGYEPNKPDASPFRGYRFRILAAQGPLARGGKKGYIVDGAMTDGFGLIAWPAKYAASGVMTFMVNQDGIVYQKDLGPDTDATAQSVAEYDPDDSWTAAQAP